MSKEYGLETVSFANDAEAAVKLYQEAGFFIEENIFSIDECDSLVKAAENLPDFASGTFPPSMQPHRADPIFLNAMRNAKIVKIMEQLVSGQVSGLQSTFYYGKPGTPGFTLHQDNWVIETKPDAFASAWVAMQDVTPDMGGLIGYPGSHREPVLPRVNTEIPDHESQDRNAFREETVLPPGYEPVSLVVPKGAALFMHSHFLHSSLTNESQKFRRSLLLTYIRTGEKFRAGNTAGRAEVNVY